MEHSRRVAVTGVTGFVGRGLPKLLAARGMAVTGVSRAGKGEVPGVDRWQKPGALDLAGHTAVINLAGEPVDRRWTAERRRILHESRVGLTREVVAAISRLPEGERPEVLVNASAVGFYGDRGDEVLTEESGKGQGFLADLCGDWEAAAREAEGLGVRVVRLRIGVVLGAEGAAFKKLRLALSTGLGGRLGSGKQWMPWIHVEDLRGALVHAVVSKTLSGAVNGTAPEPERNADFTRKFADALDRPAVLPVPGWALKLALGDFASALLGGQRALPVALEGDGFVFKYRTLEEALGDLV